jgi:hypothetical protein
MEQLDLSGLRSKQAEVVGGRAGWLWVVVVAWGFVLAFIYVFPFLLGLFFIIVPLLVLVITFALVIACLVALRQRKRKLSCLLALAVVLSLPVLAFGRGKVWGAYVFLQLNRGRLESKIVTMQAARDRQERDAICGNDCFVSTESPVRVNFHFSHCLLEWDDIVYDPSDQVVKAMENDESGRLLTDYYSDAAHLSGHWYLVHFAD